MSTDNLHKYPGNLKQHKVEPFLSDSLYEKLCEARRYPGQMITHAWDARLQQWITAAMEQEAELQRLRGLLEEARKAGDEMHKMLGEVKYNIQRDDEDYASDLDFAMTCWKRIDFTP